MVDKAKFAEEEAQGFRLTITGKNVQVTEPMRNYVSNKISKIDHFHTHIMEIHVLLEVHRMEQTATLVAKFEHMQVKVAATSSDIYASIDEAAKRLELKFYKWKDKITDYSSKKGLSDVDMVVNVYRRPYSELDEINAEIEAKSLKEKIKSLTPSKIISTESQPLKTLNNQEALMKMDLSGDAFLIFRGEEDLKLKVIYRRSDGNYGVIAVE